MSDSDHRQTQTHWHCQWQCGIITITINIAIARSDASALFRGSKVLSRHGAQHTGPRGAAQAVPAGGG